jgi:hypothetical protein
VPDSLTLPEIWNDGIVGDGKLPAFLVLVAFLLTFAFIRTSTHLIRAQVRWWPGNVSVGGTHIHHLVFGIIGLLVFGYVAVALQPPAPWREIVAVLFGVGAGLTLDEFALWVNLRDVYWAKEGRRSIDAVIIAAALAMIVGLGFSVLVEVGLETVRGVGLAVTSGWALIIAIALVNAFKGKLGMAIASLLLTPVGIVGALRLARPESPWARRFYSGDKRELARQRFDKPAGVTASAGS